MARSDSFARKWASAPAQFERPSNTLIDRGWAGGAGEDPPEAKWENWWHNRVDEALAEIESQGALRWFIDVSYRAGALCHHGDQHWVAAKPSTGVEPGSGADNGHWQPISLLEATESEAAEGADNAKRMTPRRVRQAIKATRATSTEYGTLRKATAQEVASRAAVDAAVTPDLLGDAATSKVQASQTDTTAGSILLSGAYGWGFAVGVVSPTNLNTLDQPGNYSVVGSSPNLPVASDSTVLVFGHKNRPSQIVVPENGAGPYFRGATNWGTTHTWGPWINLNSQSITGNAATATKLQTARTINGVPFDGTANITLPASTAGFSGLFAGTGHRKLPDGTIFQWGTAAVPTNGNVTHDTVVNLPTTYPTANLFAMANWRQPPFQAALGQCGAVPLNRSSITVRSGGAIVGPYEVNWYSLGH